MKTLENANGEVKVILSDKLVNSDKISIYSDRHENHVADTIYLTKDENESDKCFGVLINGTYIASSSELEFCSGDLCEEIGCDFISGLIPETIDCWTETFRHELREGVVHIDIDDSDNYPIFIINTTH